MTYRRMPTMSREIRCFSNCPTQWDTKSCPACVGYTEDVIAACEDCRGTGEVATTPEDCTCGERAEMLYDLEVERRIDEYRNRERPL